MVWFNLDTLGYDFDLIWNHLLLILIWFQIKKFLISHRSVQYPSLFSLLMYVAPNFHYKVSYANALPISVSAFNQQQRPKKPHHTNLLAITTNFLWFLQLQPLHRATKFQLPSIWPAQIWPFLLQNKTHTLYFLNSIVSSIVHTLIVAYCIAVVFYGTHIYCTWCYYHIK